MRFILDLENIIFLVILTLFFIGLFAISIRRKYSDTDFPHFSCRPLVMVPCKGPEISLEENLASLRDQIYDEFDLVAVVDNEEDVALEAIRKLGISYMVADDKCSTCSGKVRAIASAIDRSDKHEVYVVADSDGTYDKNWLELLLRPLGESRYGVSTTFPHFLPVGGLWSRIKSVWGLVGFGLMQSKITRFVWGGSMAIKAEILDRNAMKAFKKHISDDVAIMRLCKSKAKEICYVEKAAPIVKSNDTYSVFREWSNRQTALSINSSRSILRFGFLFYGGEIFILLSSVILSVLFSPLFLLYLIPYVLFAIRNYRNHLTGGTSVFALSLIIPFISILNLSRAARMREISWRGSNYDLNSQPENLKE